MLDVKQMFNTSIRVQGERISMLRFADIVPFAESEVIWRNYEWYREIIKRGNQE